MPTLNGLSSLDLNFRTTGTSCVMPEQQTVSSKLGQLYAQHVTVTQQVRNRFPQLDWHLCVHAP